MKKTKLQFLLYHIAFVFFVLTMSMFTIQSCEPDDVVETDDCDTCIIVRKPNIYFFPQKNLNLEVILEFPQGGKVIYSIPDYQNGWSIFVDTLGIIDNSFKYLFYESKLPDVWQYKKGWIVRREELTSFFNNNLMEYGFGEKEITDFTEYWIPRLNDYKFYEIYPQEKQIIDEVIKLHIFKEPDNILRLFYALKGSNDYKSNIESQKINNTFEKKGFYVTEWGVILK